MELALDSEEERKRAQTLEQRQAKDLIGHSPIEKRKGVLQQGKDMAKDEAISQAQSIGKEKLKESFNNATDYITKSNPINTAKTKAPLSNANMQGMGGPQLGATMGGQGAMNAAMAANPATMGMGGAELGALASQGATGGAAAGGAMAGLTTAMPYVAAGLAAAKLLGVKGFAQGGEIGPLSPLYRAEGTPELTIGDINEMTAYDQEQHEKNNPNLTKDQMPKSRPDSLGMLIARQKMREAKQKANEASSSEEINEKEYRHNIKGMSPDQVRRLMNNQPMIGGTGPLAQ